MSTEFTSILVIYKKLLGLQCFMTQHLRILHTVLLTMTFLNA